MDAATAAARPQPIDPLNALLLRVRAVHDAVYGAASARAPAPPPIPPAADAHGDVPADSALPLVARTARAGALLRERAQQDPALSALLSNCGSLSCGLCALSQPSGSPADMRAYCRHPRPALPVPRVRLVRPRAGRGTEPGTPH